MDFRTAASTAAVAIVAVAAYKYFITKERLEDDDAWDTYQFVSPSSALHTRDGHRCMKMEQMPVPKQYSTTTGEQLISGVKSKVCVCTTETGAQIVCHIPTVPGEYIGM